MTIAIIPARGGSKGIRLKNIQPVAGKPLIAWTIEHAIRSLWVDRVVVTTDHNEIAKVASRYGAEVFWRSPETATDTATTESALLEVLNKLRIEDDLAVLLQATSPIRQDSDIDRAIQLLLKENVDSVFSARKVEGYTWSIQKSLYKYPLSRSDAPREMRQQQYRVTLEENGSIYVFRCDRFKEEEDRLCGKVVPYLMHPLDSFQIDEAADISLIEQLISVRLPHVPDHAETH